MSIFGQQTKFEEHLHSFALNAVCLDIIFGLIRGATSGIRTENELARLAWIQEADRLEVGKKFGQIKLNKN